MSKAQFWILNLVGGICAVLILANVFLSRKNDQSGQVILGRQNEFNRAQQVHTTIQNLVGRIAQAGRSDSGLSNLLVRYSSPAPTVAPSMATNQPKAAL